MSSLSVEAQKWRRFFLSAVALVAIAAPAAAQFSPAKLAAEVDPIFAEFRGDEPGCAVGVYSAGEIEYAHGYGVESVASGAAISQRTVFDVASVSKQFTAAVVVLLAQEGRLSLDDPIRKFIPELSAVAAPVTLRQMLHNISGLRDDDTLMGFFGNHDLTSAERLRLDIRQRELNFSPGTEWEYSNTNFFLLAVVVRRVTGHALADIAHKKLFGPLAMNQTSMNGNPRRGIPHRAVGYSPDAAGQMHPEPTDEEEAGASGLFTTIGDLAHWDANFYNPVVGGPSLLAEMRAPAILESGRQVNYGLGLELDEITGAKREGHGGVTNGFRAEIGRVPAKRLGVAVLCNTSGANASRLQEEVQSALLGEEPTESGSPEDLSDLRTNGGAFIDADTLDVIVVRVDDGRPMLSLALPGSFEIVLHTVGHDRYSLGGARQYVLVPASGTTQARLERMGGRSVARTYLRQDLTRPSVDSLREYVGRYSSSELGNDLQIELLGDQLAARPRGQIGWPLLSVVPDGFTTGDLRGWRFKFERDSIGQVVRVVLVSDRVRHLAFTRVAPAHAVRPQLD